MCAVQLRRRLKASSQISSIKPSKISPATSFLRLTELGEGIEDTRRRATLNELAPQSEEAIQLRTVLNTLADARLITLNEDSAEVAHEALIREWWRLARMADRRIARGCVFTAT